MSEYVLLRYNENIVGYAKYFKSGTERTRVLHGLPLKNYEHDGQNLVVVCHVQIFTEFQDMPYPYSFGGPENPPDTLGDLNVSGRHFKAFIAWDDNQTLSYDSGCDLGDHPRAVSKTTICTETSRSGCFTGQKGSIEKRMSFESADLSLGSSQYAEDLTEFAENGAVQGSYSLPTEHRAANSSLEGVNDKMLSTRARFSRLTRPKRKSPSPFRSSDADNCDDESRHSDENEADLSSRGSGSAYDQRNIRPAATQTEVPFSQTNVVQEVYQDMQQDSDGSREEDSSSDESVEVERLSHVLPFPQKRRYVYHKRRKALPEGPRNLRKRRKVLSRRLDNPFLRGGLQCCKNLKCFDNIDHIYAFKTYKQVMGMNREDFKSFLINIYHPEEGCFKLLGRKVCARYLQKGFGFSNDLQCSVKSTPGAPAGPTAAVLPRLRISTKKDFIINFLQDYANSCGDIMPHAMFTNLPDIVRKDVYEKMQEHFRKYFPREPPPSINFFYSVWRSNCVSVRTRRNHGFKQCDTCLFLKREIANNQKHLSIVRRARESLRAHLEMVREERRMYKHRSERAVRYPKKYLSIVVDGADQTGYGLPHYLDHSKADRGHKIKIKCVGALQHASMNKLRLFLMTEDFATGANHIIEVVHRTLEDHKNEFGRLPEVLYIQVDNCGRENKNQYFLSYCEMLVALGVFLEVEVSFMPIGHTHIDIDQSFSAVAKILKRKDAPTMKDLIEVAQSCYNSKTSAERLDKIPNYSGLCEESKCIVSSANVRGFLQFRYFRFTRSTGQTESDQAFRTQCHIKVQGRDEWEPLSLGVVKGFLKTLPDLSRTPSTETNPPDNVTEINKCLMSLHGQNHSQITGIITELEALRDLVYTKRIIPFHWNLTSCFEGNGDFLTDEIEEAEGWELEENQSRSDLNQIEYEKESFIAVKPEDSSASCFWIAMVLDTIDRNNSNSPRWLRVLWYSRKQGPHDEFSARYVPSQVYDSTSKRHIPYEDQIHVDTVIVQFSTLNSQGYLRANTRSAIRQVLNLS